MDNIKLGKAARAQAFYEIGHILKYEYDGPMTREAIESFFDEKADSILSELNSKGDASKCDTHHR